MIRRTHLIFVRPIKTYTVGEANAGGGVMSRVSFFALLYTFNVAVGFCVPG